MICFFIIVLIYITGLYHAYADDADITLIVIVPWSYAVSMIYQPMHAASIFAILDYQASCWFT